jgi:hypothetical protein
MYNPMPVPADCRNNTGELRSNSHAFVSMSITTSTNQHLKNHIPKTGILILSLSFMTIHIYAS